MNNIFKTKYDITTGQCKAVSELANNRQMASSSGEKPKCGVFFGGVLGAFKLLSLALVMSGVSSVVYEDEVWIDNGVNNSGDTNNWGTTVWNNGVKGDKQDDYKNTETILLADKSNKAGTETSVKNMDVSNAVIIGSRAVGGGKSVTSIGYKAIVGKNTKDVNAGDEHQGTAVGYRAFARGGGATSLGNDTVARGESSIAIGRILLVLMVLNHFLKQYLNYFK